MMSRLMSVDKGLDRSAHFYPSAFPFRRAPKSYIVLSFSYTIVSKSRYWFISHYMSEMSAPQCKANERNFTIPSYKAPIFDRQCSKRSLCLDLTIVSVLHRPKGKG